MKTRTPQETEEHLSKTLYVRMPHTIKNAIEIEQLFIGDVKVKLPRQSSRHCHVTFENVEEKIKNLKCIKKLVIDGKHIIACPPRIKPEEEKKKKEKKMRVPKPKATVKVTKSLCISNIKLGTKAQEIRDAFPGCTSLAMLKVKAGKKTRKAILKMGSLQLAGEYLRKEREWPEVGGNRLVIDLDTRKKNQSAKKKSTGLKIYDDDAPSKKKSKKSSKQEKAANKASEDSKDEEEDDEEEPEDSNPDENSESEEE